MTEDKSPSPRHTLDSEQGQQAPYESTLDRLVERIKDESLLFVIAVCVLFVGLAALAGDSPYLRFIAAIIALLAFTGVIIHFIQGELKYRRLSSAKNPPSSREKYKAVIESKEAQRFWQPFVEDELQVVTGRFKHFGSFEPTGLVGVGSAMSLAELRTFFGVMGLSDFKVSYADTLDGDALKTNLILIGGPDFNTITGEAASRIKSTLRFGNPAIHEVSLYDSLTGQVYAPPAPTASGEVNLDYCVIIKTANPFAPTKQLLLIVGSFGYGVWAGVRFVTSTKFLEHSLVSSGKPVECLIETDIVRETPQDIRAIVMRSLDENVATRQK